MEQHKSQPRIFIIRDIHGKEWTTKKGIELIYGISAADFKKYFYDINKFGRRNADD